MTAADLARRKGLEEETVRFLRSWSLEAERKMGQLLIESERQGPGEYKKKSNGAHEGPLEIPPTL